MQITVVIPTLNAGQPLADCLAALDRQIHRDLEIIVIDNSGMGRAESVCRIYPQVKLLRNRNNEGFGAAVNRGFREARTPLVATLNDDAVAHPDWAAALVRAVQRAEQSRVGLWACRVMLDDNTLDSTGMLLARDGSSRQRGHGDSPSQQHDNQYDALCPSGSAALFRRTLLDEIGFFTEDFFLYCEDTDLGLRAIWAGWQCEYVPDAVVRHAYSKTAGRASPKKAFLVERNRLRLVLRTFPLGWVLSAPFYSMLRYGWHLAGLVQGQGKAAEFSADEPAWKLPWFVIRAHWDALAHLPELLRQRAGLTRLRRISPAVFRQIASRHRISTRKVAAL